MKNKRPFILFFIIILMMALLPVNVMAASVSVSASSKTIKEGDTVTVKVTFKEKKLYGAKGSFSYDSSVLKYVSGSNTSDGTIAVYASDPGSGASSLSVSIKFKAKKAGSATVSVSANDVINVDGESLGTLKGSVRITVKGSEEAKATPQKTAKPEQTKKPDTEEKEQTAKPSATQTPAPTPTATHLNIVVRVDDRSMLLSGNISGIDIPKGAERIKINYDGHQIDAVSKLGMTLIYLTEQDGSNGSFYRYTDGKFSPYIEIDQSKSYVILPVPSGKEVPAGFSAARLTVNNSLVQGWADESGRYLVYAVNADGDRAFYIYDYNETGMQKYAETEFLKTSTASEPEAVTAAVTTPSSAPVAAGKVVSVTVSETPSGLWDKLCSDVTFGALAGGLVILCFVLLIILLITVIKKHRSRSAGPAVKRAGRPKTGKTGPRHSR